MQDLVLRRAYPGLPSPPSLAQWPMGGERELRDIEACEATSLPLRHGRKWSRRKWNKTWSYGAHIQGCPLSPHWRRGQWGAKGSFGILRPGALSLLGYMPKVGRRIRQRTWYAALIPRVALSPLIGRGPGPPWPKGGERELRGIEAPGGESGQQEGSLR